MPKDLVLDGKIGCSSFWQLEVESRDFSHAEKGIKTANSQNDNYFHIKWS